MVTRNKIGDILQWVNRWYMHRPQSRYTHKTKKKTYVKSQQFILRLGQNLKQYWVSRDFINIIHLTTVMYYKYEHLLCAGFGWTLVFDAHNLTFVLDHHSVYFDRIFIAHTRRCRLYLDFWYKFQWLQKKIRLQTYTLLIVILYSAYALHDTKVKIRHINNFVRP